MTFSLADLASITQSLAFQHRPVQAAMAGGAAPWRQTMATVAEAAVRQEVAQAAYYAALLFDTYGELIWEVALRADDNAAAFSHTLGPTYVIVNGRHCYEGFTKLDRDTLDAIDAIDGSAAFRASVAVLNDVGDQHLIAHTTFLRDVFWQPFTCAQGAREVARAHAPEADAWLHSRLLGLRLDRGLDAPTAARREPRV